MLAAGDSIAKSDNTPGNGAAKNGGTEGAQAASKPGECPSRTQAVCYGLARYTAAWCVEALLLHYFVTSLMTQKPKLFAQYVISCDYACCSKLHHQVPKQ